MARNIIVVGDHTSHGGRVITGSPFTDINGKPVARVGDVVSCPKCGGGRKIVEGDLTLIVDGQPVARVGHLVDCGATLVSSQQHMVFIDSGGGSGAAAAAPTSDQLAAAARGNPSYWTAAAGDPAPGTQTPDHGNPSGAHWVDRFPTSSSTSDLVDPFRSHVDSFISALRRAGASVTISATRRPPERAYLMHYSWMIAHGRQDPQSVPGKPGVDIQWAHTTAGGSYDAGASLSGAQEMVNGYEMRRLRAPPALTSRHIEGKAIDMTVSWSGTLNVQDAAGRTVAIDSLPRSGMNEALQAVGASYGVHKFVGGDADPPHWSTDGH